jgi:integrase
MSESRTSDFSTNEALRAGEQARPRYLALRDGIYYFKRKVPVDVSQVLALTKTQIWKSLDTKNLVQATKKLTQCLIDFDSMVTKARFDAASSNRKSHRPRIEGTTKYLLTAHIPALLERFEYFMLETDDDERQDNGCIQDKAARRQFRQDRLAMMEDGLSHFLELAADEDYSEHEEVAQQLLVDEKLIAPPGSNVRSQLLKKLLHKDIELIKVQRDRLLGENRETPEQIPIAPRNLPTLLDLHSQWKISHDNSRTVSTYLSFVQEFESTHSALPITAINQRHVEEYRDTLAERGLVRETVRNQISGLAALVRFGMSQKILASVENPFDGISLLDVTESNSDEARRAYEITELQQLFSSKLYTQGYRPKGQSKEAGFWAPLMGLFVGGRLEEIAQLRVADIQLINGNWVIRIANLDADQHLKTKTSYRFVPVHAELIRCGFLAYVTSLKEAGNKRLFPSLKNDNINKRWSGSLGSWYGRYLDSIGLSDPRLDYHSFRFSFKQRCSQCGIEVEARDALTGHWLYQNPASRGYMQAEHRQYPLPDLVNAMAKLRYEELDLSHLYVENPLLGVTS